MKNFFKLCTVLAFLLSAKDSMAQDQRMRFNAHSHNDYSQPDPFFHAYKRGFESIEADVFILNKTLFVAHDEKDIKQGRTLKQLYLDPINEVLSRDTARTVTLLIDLKGDYHAIMPELINELKPLQKFIKGLAPSGRLTILISGNRPLPAEFKNYPEYINFDEDLMHTYTTSELKRIGQISLQYSNYSAWKGINRIPKQEALALQTVINAVHALNKPIRFWDAPDNAEGWSELLQLHADVIGTDKIDELSSFLAEDNRLSSFKP
jgi:hypothetical protein